MTDEIEDQLRAEIAAMKSKLSNYEQALSILVGNLKTPQWAEEQISSIASKQYKDLMEASGKPLSVTDAITKALADGPRNRKAILAAIAELRPGTSGQTISSALNGLKKAGSVKLKGGKWVVV